MVPSDRTDEVVLKFPMDRNANGAHARANGPENSGPELMLKFFFKMAMLGMMTVLH